MLASHARWHPISPPGGRRPSRPPLLPSFLACLRDCPLNPPMLAGRAVVRRLITTAILPTALFYLPISAKFSKSVLQV